MIFDGGASNNGYGGYLAGCKGCSIVNSKATNCRFGFTILGQDVLSTLVTRTTAETFGNRNVNCRVSNYTGHAFDINGAVGSAIIGCSAEDYAGVDTNVAFQVKGGSGGDTSGEATRLNAFVGCTVKDPNGFGGHSSTNAVFIAAR